MSHFTKLEIKALAKNEAELIAALENRYGAGSVHVSNTATALTGYDRHAGRKAHLVINKETLRKVEKRSGYNDLGFERGADGAYTLHYDPSDVPKDSLDKVMMDYAERVAAKTMRAKGFTMRRELQKDGQVKLLFSKTS